MTTTKDDQNKIQDSLFEELKNEEKIQEQIKYSQIFVFQMESIKRNLILTFQNIQQKNLLKKL